MTRHFCLPSNLSRFEVFIVAKAASVTREMGQPIAIGRAASHRSLFSPTDASTEEYGDDVALPLKSDPPHTNWRSPWQGNVYHQVLQQLAGEVNDADEPSKLWQSLLESQLSLPSAPKKVAFEKVRQSGFLPQPWIMIDPGVPTSHEALSRTDFETLLRSLVDRTDGTLFYVRQPLVAKYESWRIVPIDAEVVSDYPTHCRYTSEMDLIIAAGDAMTSVLARELGIPSISIWAKNIPAAWSLPSARQVNLFASEEDQPWLWWHRTTWNLVQQNKRTLAEKAVELAMDLIGPNRCLPAAYVAADAMFSHWTRSQCFSFDEPLIRDRHRSLTWLFREMGQRFSCPTIVETGTIRSQEDWSGAGFFTYLASVYIHFAKGTLHSIDVDQDNCQFARQWTAPWESHVHIHQSDSVAFLKSFKRDIDVLYIDSLDTYDPGHAEHALAEVQAAHECMTPESLIVLDDSPRVSDQCGGKGRLAVDWLLNQGWKIRFAGYQVILSRD